MSLEFSAALVALATTSALLPVVRSILVRRRNFDNPSSRSSHSLAIPRGAGSAQIGGAACAWVSIGFVPGPAVAAILMFGVLGLMDDLKSQLATVRLFLQVLLGIALAFMLLQVPFTSPGSIATLMIAALLAVLLTNATNFMDGLNGMSSLHGILIGGIYWVLLHDTGSDWVPIAGVTVAVSLAFLPWNWGSRARMFMGDSGSYLLGALFSGLSLASWQSGVSLWVALAPMTIYLVDVCATLARRSATGEHLLSPHRGHTYQQLHDGGMGHTKTSLIVGVFTLGAGVLAIAAQQDLVNTPVSLLCLGMLSILYLFLPKLCRSKRFGASQEGAP